MEEKIKEILLKIAHLKRDKEKINKKIGSLYEKCFFIKKETFIREKKLFARMEEILKKENLI